MECEDIDSSEVNCLRKEIEDDSNRPFNNEPSTSRAECQRISLNGATTSECTSTQTEPVIPDTAHPQSPNPSESKENIEDHEMKESIESKKPSLSDLYSVLGGPIADDFKLKEPNSYYTSVTGPTFYHLKGHLTTKPILSKNLAEQFDSLPIFGSPDTKSDLNQFYDEKIRAFVGDDLNDEDFEMLSKYCSPEHLKTGTELLMPLAAPKNGLLPNDSEEKLNIIKSSIENCDTKLCIHKKLTLRIEKDLGNHYNKKLKYRGIRIIPLAPDDCKQPANETDQDLVPGKDLLFRVRIYRPYDYNIKYFRGRSRHAVFVCDVVLPGRAALTALRDRFVCPNDVGMRLDVSEAPDVPPATNAKDVFPSGFLFINNVFYVDTRPGCVDHAAGLREWARRRGLGDFPSRDMCQAAVGDIVMRLGYPEVYVHQGNCEHLFTFSEIRLLGPADPSRLNYYPRNTAISSHQSVYCTTCAEFCAKWVVSGCDRVPFDPAFFCDTCFKLYLYQDGEKIGDFKAYSYKVNELSVLKPQPS
ncbi:uncharacterized protein LOC114360608 isoform X5 [Ostrinia furnacalis]|uniref:uncharacterized protein LOC114360608 isoform X5 n=1 Tax=Ostrinia furnacalis TaxID=93504 RepID=UPI00103ED09D|nr:uncharacterized protein LOC114360608 isoform X5 [Ostrinia furnacalis]